MTRNEEEFLRAWDAPNTLRLTGQTMAVLRNSEGVKILLHHGGQTLAMEFNLEAADDLAQALG